MKLRNIILSSALILGSLAAGAQNKQEKTELTFVPHWYIQGQFGAQETLGETSFGHLISPNMQIAGGYNFNPYIGVRLAIDSWQSRGAFDTNGNRNSYKWNFIAPTIDATVDLTNLLFGYEERCFGVGVLAGIGANFSFGNDGAERVKNRLEAMTPPVDGLPLYWDGSKVRFMGKFGAYADYYINDQFSAGFEFNANVLPDAYNSKRAHNADWYFNALVGVKYNFGKTHEKKAVVVPAVAPQIKVVHDTVFTTVHDTVYADKIKQVTVTNTKIEKKEALRRDVFFMIAKNEISEDGMQKVKEVAEFLKKDPEAKGYITGYADKGTGSMAVNLRLAKERANIVARVLMGKFGIPATRLIVKSMDEFAEQPYTEPEKNRLAICVVE